MADDPATPEEEVSEADFLQVRREKLASIREAGLDPFGGRFETTHEIADLQGDKFKDEVAVTLAGRVLSRRGMGKTTFFDVGDVHGRIQCYLNIKGVSEQEWDVFTKMIDIGDFVGIRGETFHTQKGEPSIKVEGVTILSKSLRPLPEKWHGLSDKETVYRQRYLDLVSSERSREVFLKRSGIISAIRRFLEERGFIEVETPMMQPVAGGAAARPFVTHHNSLDMDLYLRIAPECYLKRLLVAGFPKVFELNRNFRNEGISRRHNPEFTMLEAYFAYADFEVMAELVEEMICGLAEEFSGGLKIDHHDEQGELIRTLDLSRPWKRRPFRELVAEAAGADWFEITPEARRERCQELGVEISAGMEDYEVSQQVFEKLVEEKTFDPLYVTHVPAELVPLARQNVEDPSLVDVYELIINGQEISPGYSELNDPVVQRDRLEAQVGEETQLIDEDFITALEHGMPPAGGIGIGIDRLVMLLCGAESIRDVVLFPQLRKR